MAHALTSTLLGHRADTIAPVLAGALAIGATTFWGPNGNSAADACQQARKTSGSHCYRATAGASATTRQIVLTRPAMPGAAGAAATRAAATPPATGR